MYRRFSIFILSGQTDLSLALLISLLGDARKLLQLRALVEGDVFPRDDLLLDLRHLIAQ